MLSGNVLLIGPMGSGKTTQLRTLPGKKFAYLFDKNAVASVGDLPDLTYELWLPKPGELDTGIRSIKKGGRVEGAKERKELKLFTRWVDDVNKRFEAGFFKDFDIVAIDSCTPLVRYLMADVMFLQDKVGRDDQRTDYRIGGEVFSNVMQELMGLPNFLFVTCHVREIEDDTTHRIINQILLPGSARDQIPLMFDNVFKCECTSTKDKDEFIFQTRSDRKNLWIRCSIRGLSMFQDATIKDWGKPQKYGLGHFLSEKEKKNV